MRIGIPRTLWYFSYAPFWDSFFKGLGHQVVVSPPTSRETLDAGIRTCVSEACLPLKVFFGHLESLAGKVDRIFLPRLICLSGNRVFCPKFLGLPDLARHSGMALPPLLEVRLDRRKGPLFLYRACSQLGRELGASPRESTRAYLAALRVQRRYRDGLAQGRLPVGARPPQRPPKSREREGSRPLRVALMGYPYLLFDAYINLGLLDKLRAHGIEWRTAATVSPADLSRQNPRFPKRPFWYYSDQVARAGYHFFGPGRDEVDGVIHVTAFACGPDAVVDKLLEMEAERQSRPFMNITLDEQSGDAGYVTRLEAFVDMLRQREVIAHAQ